MPARSPSAAPAPLETLEPRNLFAANPVITEFMASNGTTLDDGFGNSSDWIELYNAGDTAIDLADHHLTDSATDPTQWRFSQSTVLGAGDYTVVFASGLNTVDPQGNAHTSFSLSAGGEYLALTDPDGLLLDTLTPGGSDYPEQIRDVSYGRSGANLINADTPAQILVPASSSTLGTSWTAVGFNAGANGFNPGTASVGYEANPGGQNSYSALINTPVPQGTIGVYQRIAFNLTDASQVSGLELLMQSDDGFVAYLNGTRVASLNAPASPQPGSTATGQPSDQDAITPRRFGLDAFSNLLQDGANVLAIHALNFGPGSSDMLSIATLNAQGGLTTGYLASPTPGAANGPLIQFGPAVTLDEPAAGTAIANQALTVTGAVNDFAGVAVNASTAQLHYRVGFGAETTVNLTLAADGSFSATLPASAFAPGNLVRWYATADDVNGLGGRGPRFLDPLNRPEYVGVVADNPAINTDLRLLQWFVQDTAGAQTDAGARGALFVNGRLYDNIQTDIHGQSTRTAEFPKKSFDFDANSGHKFELFDSGPAVSDFNLITNYADQTKLRHSLANYATAQTGGAHLLAEPVTVYRNGQFFGLFDLVEDGDGEYLERLGLDPNNPLYKVNNPLNSATEEISKVTRKHEGFEDYQEILTGNNFGGNPSTAGNNWDFDTLDLASWVNLTASQSVIANADYGHKNQFLYRDTTGTGQWSILPWDLDLSFGHSWNPQDQYFDPNLNVNRDFPSILNNVISRLHNNPRFDAMFRQRAANLTVQLFGAPGTSAASSVVGAEIVRLSALVSDEAAADLALWGLHSNFSQTPAQAQSELLDDFIVQRRNYVLARVVSPETSSGALRFGTAAGAFDVTPASGDPAEQYLTITNPTGAAVDMSGWTLTDGIDYTFAAGTVLPAGDTLYVAADVQAFLDRTTGPRGGQQRFVQGNFSGQLTDNGEEVVLRDENGVPIDTLPLPDNQPDRHLDQLRISEVHYNPIGDEEFVELTNLSPVHTLDLDGVSLTEGPSTPFTFGSGVTVAPGQSIVITSDAAAFAATYPGVPISGVFIGSLSNGGEALTLVDHNGDPLLSFTYDDAGDWPTAADGTGSSLTLIDPATDVALLGNGTLWRASFTPNGTPGTLIDNPPAIATVEGRYAFYNGSFFDGDDPGANAGDDNALATDKQALLPGQTATFANVTPYSEGVNGIILDIANLAAATLQADDFAFAIGNGDDPTGFVDALLTPVIDVRPGGGANGTDRVSLALPDRTARNQWLRVTVLRNTDTGLSQNDVFYFGNLPGDTGDSATAPRVNVTDIRRTASRSGQPALVDDLMDFNRDGRINVTDIRLSIAGSGTRLDLLTAPAAAPVVGSTLDRALAQRAAASYVQWQRLLGDGDDEEDEELASATDL